MEFGISFPATLDAPRQAQFAEELGFTYVGFYDTPALEADVWITVANALQATRTIHVGPQVLIPSLRHPIAQAAAIATIEQLAPGRLYVAMGTGFTGRMAMGQRPLTWASMRTFLVELRALLAGDQIEIEGAVTQMLHPLPSSGLVRPAGVPLLVAANGPKGIALAREMGDGLVYGGSQDQVPQGFSMLQLSAGNFIVLEEGESASSPRVLDAARIGFATRYHVLYEGSAGQSVLLEQLPYGSDWRKTLDRHPAEVRHLIVHDQHCVGVNDLDAEFIDRHPDALEQFAAETAITRAQYKERIEAVAALGATRISFPSYVDGDWASLLRTYAAIANLEHLTAN
ncbi:MAG TPA: LLM class flavin-dependent oxidoreductase [Chloroflexota bacterium]|nr:LLM class flavin-dependent oxidoreductase [Chloroflexota bacterium]